MSARRWVRIQDGDDTLIFWTTDGIMLEPSSANATPARVLALRDHVIYALEAKVEQRGEALAQNARDDAELTRRLHAAEVRITELEGDVERLRAELAEERAFSAAALREIDVHRARREAERKAWIRWSRAEPLDLTEYQAEREAARADFLALGIDVDTLIDDAPALPPDPPVRSRDAERLREAHERIAAMPNEQQREAMARASRSYSAPRSCVEHDGCRIDTGAMEMVWPDGERWPMRLEAK